MSELNQTGHVEVSSDRNALIGSRGPDKMKWACASAPLWLAALKCLWFWIFSTSYCLVRSEWKWRTSDLFHWRFALNKHDWALNEHSCHVVCSFTRPQICGVKSITEKPFSSKKCLTWFHKYASPDLVVGPEAMEKFCEDIGVEPENVSGLLWFGVRRCCRSKCFHWSLGRLPDYHVSFSVAPRGSQYGILH